MSKLPPNFAVTLRLIQTLRSLPTTVCGACGYTCDEIQAQHNAVFPNDPLTVEQACALLVSGVKKGVFLYGGCASGAVTTQECKQATLTTDNDPVNQLFYINTAMAAVNPANNAYVAVGYQANPNTPRLGYLPCSTIFCASGGGVGANPYAGSATSRSNIVTVGGTGGTPAPGSGCPSFIACGTSCP